MSEAIAEIQDTSHTSAQIERRLCTGPQIRSSNANSLQAGTGAGIGTGMSVANRTETVLDARRVQAQQDATLDAVVRAGGLQVEPREPQPRRSNKYWIVVVLAVLGAAVYYLARSVTIRDPSASAVPLRTATVRAGAISRTLRLTGSTAAENNALLRAPYLRGRRSIGSGDFGLVLEELTPSGTRVSKQDRVAVFDLLSMQNRLDNNRADRVEQELQLKTIAANLDVKLAAHQQSVRMAKARLDKAVLDLKTAPVRSAIQVALFQLAFDEAQATYKALVEQTRWLQASANSERRMAMLELQEAQVEERRASANVDRMVVRAPVSGLLVVSETMRSSELVPIRAGDQLRRGQPYARIVDTRSIIIEATANQVDIHSLRIGAPARVHFDAYPDLELPARLHSIAPLASGRRSRPQFVSEIPVVLELERRDPRLIPNLSAHTDIVIDSEEASGIIPREAVFKTDDGGQPIAYVQTPSGWETRALELGIANHVDIGVVSGLSPGEVVALSEPSS